MVDRENSDVDQETNGFQRDRLPLSLPISGSVYNEHDCSYLDDRWASMPLAIPDRLMTLDEVDFALANGLRRSGVFVYHTACEHCQACQPTRVNVHDFHWRDSFNRVLKRGKRDLRVAVGWPTSDETRLALFNSHRSGRGLGGTGSAYASADYEGFLVETCCTDTLELSFWVKEELAGISIVDCGSDSFSAVYTYFDPKFSKLSIGTFSILVQMEFAMQTGRNYVYLGMYVQQNRHLNYKANFLPQERYIDRQWVRIDDISI
jgi:leucyl-tRNA---protein transferase